MPNANAHSPRRTKFVARACARIALVAAASGLLAGAASAEPLRLVGDPWAPYVDRALPHHGLSAGIVTEALTRAGHTTKLTITEWDKAMEGAQTGSFDVLVGAWESEERAKVFAFSEPYLFNEIKLVKLRDAPFSFADILAHTRPELTMGLVREYSYGGALAPLRSYSNRTETYLVQVLLRLVQGEVDFVVGDDRAVRHHVREMLSAHAQRVEISPDPLAQAGLRLAIALDHPRRQQVLEDFARSLAAMRADGSLAKIFAEFGMDEAVETGRSSPATIPALAPAPGAAAETPPAPLDLST